VRLENKRRNSPSDNDRDSARLYADIDARKCETALQKWKQSLHSDRSIAHASKSCVEKAKRDRFRVFPPTEYL